MSAAVLLTGIFWGLHRAAGYSTAIPGDFRDAPNSSAYHELSQFSDNNDSAAIIETSKASVPANRTLSITGEGTCDFIFAWGHDKEVLSFLKSNSEDNIVIQGCDVGKGGFNMLEEVGLFQNGHNGTWFGGYHNNKANAGFNLFNLSGIRMDRDYNPDNGLTGIEKIYEKNNLLGFMRMTQTHFIGIMKDAMERVKNRECGEVMIKFTCPSEFKSYYVHPNTRQPYTMGTGELNGRIEKAFSTKLDPAETTGIPNGQNFPGFGGTTEVNNDLSYISSVLNDFADICGKDLVCGRNGIKSFPEKCGQVVEVDRSFQLSKGCLECYEYLQKYRTVQGERTRIVEKSVPQEARELYKYINLPQAK